MLYGVISGFLEINQVTLYEINTIQYCTLSFLEYYVIVKGSEEIFSWEYPPQIRQF